MCARLHIITLSTFTKVFFLEVFLHVIAALVLDVYFYLLVLYFFGVCYFKAWVNTSSIYKSSRRYGCVF